VRQQKRWRYYCDHCRKSGGSKSHMAAHERGCTANPQRVCGICAKAEFQPKPLAELIEFVQGAAVDWEAMQGVEYGTLNKAGLIALRQLADGCPVCTFAALRQAHVYSEETFELKKEMESVWAEINSVEENRRAG
jgi:hypothetical protein